MLTNILYLIQLRVIHACTALTEIKNMENLYTDACTNMSYMFSSCTSLTTLDLRSFNTSACTNMSYMFEKSNPHNMFNTNLNTTGVTRIKNVYSTEQVKTKFCTTDSFASSSTYWQTRGVQNWIIQP